MRFKALAVALTIVVLSANLSLAEEVRPKVAIAYDIGYLGDNSFNDAVNAALVTAKKKYRLVEPFIREVLRMELR